VYPKKIGKRLENWQLIQMCFQSSVGKMNWKQDRSIKKGNIMNKTAFVISIVLTTFILMAVGGIAYAVLAAGQAPVTASSPTAAPLATSDSTGQQAVQQELQQVLNEREAAYQQMIAEANTRLEQAQQQQQALEAQLAALQAPTSNQAVEPQATTISPEDAAAIASKYWGQSSVYTVEVVPVRGENMYQVTFSSGDVVFVDMNGQVAGAITATQLASLNVQSQSSSRGGSASGGGYEEHENESGDD
jgi:CBS-domain-containing membrane protein